MHRLHISCANRRAKIRVCKPRWKENQQTDNLMAF